jgi:hypothetical protein
MLSALRPKPFRGDQVAAGAVVLTALVALLNLRFENEWGAGVHVAYTGLAAAFLLAMAVSSPLEGASPRAFQSVLYLTALAHLLLTLVRVADVLGSDGGAGTVVWVAAAISVAAFWFARERNSAVCTLVGAIAGVVALVALPYWLFSAESVTNARWVLALSAGALAFAAVGNRDRHRRHAVQLVDAAGAAVLALGLSFVGFGLLGFDETGGVATGWEIVVLAGAFGSIAYASVDKEPGPAAFGVAILATFVLMAADARDPSLVGWPLVLALMAGFLLVVGLRPTSPAPPEPGSASGDEPPAVTTIRVP